MSRLPNQYVVKCDTTEESTEVASFIKGVVFHINGRYVIKHEGLLSKHHTDANIWDEIPEKVKNLPIYIYSQWLILRDTKDFVLPEKWYIKCTELNRDILNKWRRERADITWHDDKYFNVGQILLSKNLTDRSYYFGDSILNYRYDNYQEITLFQFKKYVLKEEDFILPEKWFVLYKTREEFDIINNHFNKNWTYRKTVNLNGYVNHPNVTKYNNWVTNHSTSISSKVSLLKEGYNQLSFAEFQKHIVKNTTKIKQDKMRTITSSQGQDIINIACGEWKPKLAKKWAENIVLGESISIGEDFYKEMRKACDSHQNKLFDTIFGKDILFKEGDWVITTTTISEGNNKHKKGEVFKIIKSLDDRAYFDKYNAVDVNRLAIATELDRVKYVKKQMIELANSFDLVPSKIIF